MKKNPKPPKNPSKTKTPSPKYALFHAIMERNIYTVCIYLINGKTEEQVLYVVL